MQIKWGLFISECWPMRYISMLCGVKCEWSVVSTELRNHITTKAGMIGGHQKTKRDITFRAIELVHHKYWFHIIDNDQLTTKAHNEHSRQNDPMYTERITPRCLNIRRHWTGKLWYSYENLFVRLVFWHYCFSSDSVPRWLGLFTEVFLGSEWNQYCHTGPLMTLHNILLQMYNDIYNLPFEKMILFVYQ